MRQNFPHKPAIASVLIGLLISLAVSSPLQAQKKPPSVNLERNFVNPPDSIRPYVYWYWLNDHISVEGAIADLKAMKEIGIGGAFIGNIGLTEAEGTSYGTVKLFSDTWWDATLSAIRYASKQDFTIGMFNGPGWSQSGGPWIDPHDSMRYISANKTSVRGSRQISISVLPENKDNDYVASIAYPTPLYSNFDIKKYNPCVLSNNPIENISNILDGSLETEASFPSGKSSMKEFYVDVLLSSDMTARSITMHPSDQAFSADFILQAKQDSGLVTIKEFNLNRSNANLNTGFIPFAPLSISFDSISSKQFRLIIKNIKGKAGLKEIVLSPGAVVENYMEKQLAKMYHSFLPLWKEYQWSEQEEPVGENLTLDPTKIINLKSFINEDGLLHWNVPEGEWTILNYYMSPTMVTNSPASPQGIGLEVDKMNKEKLVSHFDSFIGKVLQRLNPDERKALQYVVADSYETGSQNWTDAFEEKFKTVYGYDPLPWLPVLSGAIVGSADQSDRFLWDLRRLIADMVAYEYVGGLRDLSHKNGLKLWLENYGHWGYPSEFLMYGGQTDEVAGEFWNEGTLGDIENRSASSAAHIYGKNRVWAESFTAGGSEYMRSPGMLKKRGDWSFTEGINQTLLHLYIHQPDDGADPGINAWFGTEFNRKNTWFYQGKAFIDYLRRCNYLLQQGKPVNDIAYFISEDAPKMTGIRDPELPLGYSFDYINAEVILDRLEVNNGKLVLPDGVQYSMLVLPPLNTMRPELLNKIQGLVNNGAVIMGPAPVRSPSLQDFPEADSIVKAKAASLWGGKQIQPGIKAYGKGLVMEGISMQEALDYIKFPPDFLPTNQEVKYAHRTTPDEDIYFITNQSGKAIEFSASFRVKNTQPSWWNPVDGTVRNLYNYSENNGMITIPIKLEENESGFVVFKKAKVEINKHKDNFPVADVLLTIQTPWDVTFDTAMRGPAEPVVFNTLSDWTENKSDDIKYYSGTATYKTSFNIKKSMTRRDGKLLLDLGTVQVMAKVKINGVDCGTVWTAPKQVDISKAIKKGKNVLEIEVVNTWVNRLIGDSSLPVEDRKFKTEFNRYSPESPLQPSGLLGPVTIQNLDY
ncbi:glycosyl hydrolase [Flavobacteriaceae bacterium LMO-SS05]